MNFKKRNPKIYVLSGKAKSGKDYVASVMEKFYSNQKCIRISYAYYLKDYLKRMNCWDGKEETKPRELLQQFGIELIKNQISDTLLIERVKQDIEVFSYFYDVIFITDARRKEEIEMPKQTFSNVTTIRIERKHYEDGLTESERNHYSETALDDYHNYDYVIFNHGEESDLKHQCEMILKEESHGICKKES